MAINRQFIEQMLLNSGAISDPEPVAIFMAGLPGAGKTEISKNLIKDSGVNLFRIDMDELAEKLPGYAPAHADEFRKDATTVLSKCFDYAIHHNISFIMDGTFGGSQAQKNIERCLKHGFGIKIIYVLQDPKIAWRFTLAREKVEHRAIKFDGFVDAYYKTLNNLKEISLKYDNKITIDIAIKDRNNGIGDWKRGVNFDEIDELAKTEYNKDKLIKHILGE